MEDTMLNFLHPDTFEPLEEPKKKRWLKVKDDFDLTKLDKYGFEKFAEGFMRWFGEYGELFVGEDRIISYEADLDYMSFNEVACILFEMSKDGILEIKEKENV